MISKCQWLVGIEEIPVYLNIIELLVCLLGFDAFARLSDSGAVVRD